MLLLWLLSAPHRSCYPHDPVCWHLQAISDWFYAHPFGYSFTSRLVTESPIHLRFLFSQPTITTPVPVLTASMECKVIGCLPVEGSPILCSVLFEVWPCTMLVPLWCDRLLFL